MRRSFLPICFLVWPYGCFVCFYLLLAPFSYLISDYSLFIYQLLLSSTYYTRFNHFLLVIGYSFLLVLVIHPYTVQVFSKKIKKIRSHVKRSFKLISILIFVLFIFFFRAVYKVTRLDLTHFHFFPFNILMCRWIIRSSYTCTLCFWIWKWNCR